MKHLKSQFLLMMAVVITILFSITAFAENGIMPRWDYLIMLSADMDVTSYNAATVHAEVDSDSRDVDTLKVTVKLQQFNGGWKDYKTWTVDVDDSFATIKKQTAIPKGYSYQIELTAKAYKNGKFLESATETFDYGFYQ